MSAGLMIGARVYAERLYLMTITPWEKTQICRSRMMVFRCWGAL